MITLNGILWKNNLTNYNVDATLVRIGKEYLYALAAVVVWGTSAPVCKVVMGNISEGFFIFASSFCSFLCLFILNLANYQKIMVKGYKTRDFLTMSLLGFIGLTLYTYFYYIGIVRLPAAEPCTINYF